MRVLAILFLVIFVVGSSAELCAAPEVSRILRKNNKLEGRRDGVSRVQEPAYRTPGYYPESYPEYGRSRSSEDAGWQRVRDNQSHYNPTPSYGVGGPRSTKRRRF